MGEGTLRGRSPPKENRKPKLLSPRGPSLLRLTRTVNTRRRAQQEPSADAGDPTAASGEEDPDRPDGRVAGPDDAAALNAGSCAAPYELDHAGHIHFKPGCLGGGGPLDISGVPRFRSNELGFLDINSVPPSTVALDGELLGRTPLVKVVAVAGTHTLEFLTSGSFAEARPNCRRTALARRPLQGWRPASSAFASIQLWHGWRRVKSE
jgi:hypothetical protein